MVIAGGESHRVWIEKSGPRRVMVASTPTEASVMLDHVFAQGGEATAGTARRNVRPEDAAGPVRLVRQPHPFQQSFGRRRFHPPQWPP